MKPEKNHIYRFRNTNISHLYSSLEEIKRHSLSKRNILFLNWNDWFLLVEGLIRDDRLKNTMFSEYYLHILGAKHEFEGWINLIGPEPFAWHMSLEEVTEDDGKETTCPPEYNQA